MGNRTFLAIACVFAWPANVLASPVDAQLQAARELFQEAEKDEDAGEWAVALDKVKRVAEVKLTAGVRYHQALCEEHLGQIASALADYTSAENQAQAEGAQDVLRLVGKQIAALGPRVPRLTIRLVPDLPEAQVKLDGVPVVRALVGVAIPLDPGPHRIEAEAPDRAPAATTVILQERDSTVLDVPLQASAPRRSPAPPAHLVVPAKPPREANSSTVPVAVTAGASLLLAGGGVAAFLLAGSAQENGQRDCAEVVSTSAGACGSDRTVVRAWDFAAAGMWVGAAALGAVSVYLWSARVPRPMTAFSVGPGGFALRCEF